MYTIDPSLGHYFEPLRLSYEMSYVRSRDAIHAAKSVFSPFQSPIGIYRDFKGINQVSEAFPGLIAGVDHPALSPLAMEEWDLMLLSAE